MSAVFILHDLKIDYITEQLYIAIPWIVQFGGMLRI